MRIYAPVDWQTPGKPKSSAKKRPSAKGKKREKVECYRSDNGQLENDLDRVKAHDLLFASPQSAYNSNSKVLDWTDCLRILENADIVMPHLKEFIELRDAEKAKVVLVSES